MAVVGIIIPTWNSPQMLIPCVQSILTNSLTDDLFHIYVVNNGDAAHVEGLKDNLRITVLQQEMNLGWEGGLKAGLAASTEKFVVFMNDDTFVPPSNRKWLHNMLEHFAHPDCAAAGPSSNTVMGMQNMLHNLPQSGYEVKFLIGFCMMVRRDYLDQAGGVDDTLPGGDDLDLSIRLRAIGKYLVHDRETFIYHYGFVSGVRKHGSDYNSAAMIERTNHALIRKHGLKAYMDLWIPCEQPSATWRSEDVEGDAVRNFVKGDKVVELGCGDQKTVPNAIGIDMIPKGEHIPGLAPDRRSIADHVGNVVDKLPVSGVDTIIARHILEHCVPTVEVLTNWKDALNHGGRLIIAVPNHEIRNSIPLNYQHVHAFTPKTLKTQMESLGFKTIDIVDPNNGISFVGAWEKNGN